MTAGEKGFLLLSCCLGDPERKVLSSSQLRNLTKLAGLMNPPFEDRELTVDDLAAMGCSELLAKRVHKLLSDEELLAWYLRDGRQSNCYPITRISEDYPSALYKVLGQEAPGSLWTMGNTQLLKLPKISLVGSRDLHLQNRNFAAEAGRQAAKQGYVLVSGNARGADIVAQNACLAAGGSVISIVADALNSHREHERILYLSEDGFDLPFSSLRALRRNRLIHSLGAFVLVAQCRVGKGGTWSGTVNNLQKNLRPVFCFADGSSAMVELVQRGAGVIRTEDLSDFGALRTDQMQFM